MAINTTDFLSLNGLILMMMVLVESTPMMMESPIVQNHDRAELTYIGDESNINGGTGNYNLFFNSYNLSLSRSIDWPHIYIRNQTAVDAFGNYPYECMSLKDSVVDINFEFVSNEDGKNGLIKGLRGVGFDNITLKEFTLLRMRYMKIQSRTRRRPMKLSQ